MKLTSINIDNITDEIIKMTLFNTYQSEYQYADYAIIFGCHLKQLLDERIIHAIKVLNNKTIKKLIITGGVGIQGNFNEAEYIKKELLKNSINKEIIIEDKSKTTEENVINSIEILKKDNTLNNKKIVLISSQAHLRRIGMEYRKQLLGTNFEIYYEYPASSIISYENIIKSSESRNLAVNEIKKIIKFIDLGIVDNEDI